MSITSNIANVAYLLYTGANIPNLNADYLDNQTGTYYTDKSNTALSLAQTALDAANNVGPGAQIQPYESYVTDSSECVTQNTGIINTESSLENAQIFETIKWSKLNIPIDQQLYY